ncbi:MAG: SUMF1/EgtB/PvdO family nonheme iron enzyme [Cyanobacteria bacterium P01_E01_bin.34]
MFVRTVTASAISISLGLLASCIFSSQFIAQSLDVTTCGVDGEFVWIPEGSFISGSDRTERDYAYQVSAETAAAGAPERVDAIARGLRQSRWFEGEFDRQERTLPGYCIAANLVTNDDYLEFVTATRHREPGISSQDYQIQGFLVHPYSKVEEFLWQGGTYPTGEGLHPVVLVSYDDALAYAEWRGDRDGAQYRLPTEAEWEKAARGDDGRYFPWGNEWETGATNVAEAGVFRTNPVAEFPLSQSVYGVEDMSGNVFEYTSTVQERNGQTVSVMKGCSWDDLPGFCRAAYRHTRPIDSRHILFGFRLVRES